MSTLIIAIGFGAMIADALMQYHYLSYYGVFNYFKLTKYIKVFWRHILLAVYFITIPIHYSND